jgi:uncharacterized repeat protein (TIGR01451 family)
MSHKESTVLGRWSGLVGAAILLALCLILVSGQQAAAAQDGPTPYRPTFERPTSSAPRGPAVESKPRVVQDLESRPASLLGQRQVNPGFTVDLLYNAVWGVVDSGEVVTVTRTGDGAYGAAEVNDKGFFSTPLWQATGQPADIADGDTIEIYVDGSLEATIPVVGVSGGIDVLADEVDGAILNGIAGTPVTVTIGLEGGQPPSNAPQATATTDPAGSFTAAFAGMDLGASNLAAVEYPSGGGRVRACLYPNDRGFEVWNMRGVRGYADPGQQVDVTVYEGAGPTVRWSGNGTAGEPHGFYDIGLSGPGSAEAAQPGDLVAVDLGGGEVLSTTIAGLGITGVDPALDQIQGTAPAGETVVVRLWQEGGYAQTTATAAGGGAFTADLSGIADLRPRDTFRVALADAEGDESLLQSGAPHLDVYLDPLSPNDCVVWRVDGPFLPITLTIQTSTGVYTRENPIGPSDAGNTSGPFCYLVRGPDWGPIDFAPGDTVTLRSPTWVGSLVIPDITWSVDTANDQVSGEAPSGEVVVTVRDWSADRYPVGGSDTQSTTTASPYTVAFPNFDVRDGGTVDVHYYEPGSDYGAWYYGWGNLQYQYFEVDQWGVSGVPPTADEYLTAYLYEPDGSTLIATTDFDYDGDPWRFSLHFEGQDIMPGHWVTITGDSGWTAGLQVPYLTVEADEDTEMITGQGPTATIMVEHGWNDGQEWSNHFVPVNEATGLYALDRSFFGGDVHYGDEINAIYQAPGGDRVRQSASWPRMHVNYGENWVLGEYPIGHTFWITVTDGGGTPKAYAQVDTTPGGAQWFGNGFMTEDGDWDGGQRPNIMPNDWVHFRASDGYTNTIQVGTIIGELDAGTDTVWGTITAPWFTEPISGFAGAWGFDWENFTVDPNGGAYFVNFTEDLQPGWSVDVGYVEPDGSMVSNVIYPLDLRMDVNYGHDWVQVETVPGATITVTVAGKGTVVGQADGNGWFNSNDWPWDAERPDLQAGDVVTATAIGLTASVHPIGIIEGEVDADADTVSGVIYVPFLTVTVQCEVWTWGGPTIVITDVNGSGGSYFCDFGAIGWDIQAGPTIAVRYFEPDGDTVINTFEPPWMRVNYGDDWVGATYPAGHTFWITVTDAFGTPKGYAQIDSVPGGGWGGDGFETRDEDWLTGRPDIQPWDWVYARADDGYTHALEAGDITGNLDIGENTVEGTMTANFAQTLSVRCEVWVENGPDGIDTTAEPNGGSYSCDFDDVGWDLLPGQTVSVRYYEPDDNDAVVNTFREPAPNMYIEKWVEGSGQVTPGGPVVYGMRYRNHGSVEATTVYLTDTLPANTTYVTDTSGFPAAVVGNQVVWTFGPVASQEEARFQLVLTNTATEGDTLVNQADIWTLYDEDPGNNHAEAQAQVVGAGEQPDVWVNKNPSPGDPAPGQTMLWEIDYGNNGPVASGPVVLTDTIPDGTSIVSWFSENGYNLWTEHSIASQFILEAPSIPGSWGDRIYLRLHLDPGLEIGTQLTNTVEIYTDNDSDPNNDWHQRNDVWVNEARWNVGMDKNMDWGELVPGGYVVYHLNVRNHGNMAAHTWLTDTFPSGTSFVESWIWTGGGEQPFPPTSFDDTIAFWDLGEMPPAAWFDIGVRLAINGALEPGTALTNCAEITINGPDNWPYDDAECVAERIYDFGPNLRIEKNYQWEGDGVIRYELYVQNLGTTRLEPVWVTDAYPDGLSFNGDWWVGHGPWITLTHDGPNQELTFWYQQLDPGNTARVYYRLDMDAPGTQGVCFTNAAESPLPGDVWPADNSDAVTACTGPDVYVEKWLSGGEPRPGEMVTFTVQFGNQNRWPWNGDDQYGSHITDTLPAGMTFITATAPWNPDDRWQPERIEGNTIVWGWGPMWADNWWRFDIVAQITGPVEDGDVLVNTVEAYGDSPDDVEPDYDNNVFHLPLTVLAPEFQVSKTYETTGLTGGIVTYTLTVENVGSVEATHVVLSDTLPSGLIYGGGDGVFDGSDVTWTIASIAAGDSATAWFWATLSDEEGTVTNDAYRVVSSDQGITSAFGPPVSFPVTAANYYVYLPIVLKNHTP